MSDLRNIAIIAHVDHGKTTLVDSMFRQAGTVRANQRIAERAMDSNDLERERGITILAKCTSVEWNGIRVNIVDTPGHADFGGEVERILSMVDGVILLVDAAEGPMPQTKFVTSKALALGLRPIVVVNKVDKPEARTEQIETEVFDLFAVLGASDEQLEFPCLYASGRDGWVTAESGEIGDNLAPLFETVLAHVPPPKVDAEDAPFRMLATLLDRDPFLGRVLTGRIESGTVKMGMTIKAMKPDGTLAERARISKLLAFRGLDRVGVDEAHSGDIVAIAGLTDATVADTLAEAGVKEPLAAQPVDPPTLSMTFRINDSPLAGRDGKKVTSRVIRDRLMREAEGNVAIHITEAEDRDLFEVAGRGELQLGVLIETMRREGFELAISRPRVIYREDDDGNRTEPMETVQIDVDDEYTGVVVEKIAARKGEMTDMRPSGGGKTRITFDCPSRGLIGYHGEFLTDTRGTGIMHRIFDRYGSYKGKIEGRRQGVLVSNAGGKVVAFALWNLEERGVIFVSPGDETYEGMIIGEHSRENDLPVNPMKSKQLTNIRAAGKDDAVKLTTPRKLKLEEALAYMNDDELLEVTPNSLRLRKRHLKEHERRKASRAGGE